MSSSLYPPLRPRRGKILQVLGIARVSKPQKDRHKGRPRKGEREELSLEDQEALLRTWLHHNYGKRFRLRVIASTGSGEFLDREESALASAEVESEKYDVVLTEDLGRIFRRVHAYLFCECCEDHDARLIALNDYGVDTGREDWRMAAFFAVMRHEAYNRDAALRIRRTLRNRFTQGGVCQTFPYGYAKPAGARSDEEVSKGPDAGPVYEEWFRLLENDAYYTEVADWLNQNNVPTGPGCRGEKWTGRMVQRVTFNPILKGERRRNVRVVKRVNETGRRKSERAPPGELLVRHCPHLAFIEPERSDRLIRKLTSKNGKYARGREAAAGRRGRITKKWRAWPGWHLCCGVCGRPYYWGGHGQAEHMMCSGARDYLCWNGVTLDGLEAGRKLCAAILAEVEALPDFEPTFLRLVRAKAKALKSGQGDRLKQVWRELEKVRRRIALVRQQVLDAKGSRTLGRMLLELEAEEDHLLEQQKLLQQQPQQDSDVPPMDRIKQEVRQLMALLPGNPEFGQRMRELVPSLTVLLYRLLDGGAVVLRAKLTLNLARPVPEAFHGEELDRVLRKSLTVDLFDPPQRERFRQRVADLRAKGLTEAQAASELGITVTAAQRAAALQRLMDEQGRTDAYALVTEPPADCTKLRRHLHPRYHFEPLPGYPDW